MSKKMDYESIHGPGFSNFSSPSPHRIPTVSAAQALQDLKTSPTRSISTSLPALDLALQNIGPQSEPDESFMRGLSRGKITEAYGPPGVGKTALGMQIAANALHAGEHVVWVDASHPLPGLRFLNVIKSCVNKAKDINSDQLPRLDSSLHLLNHLTHFSTPTLAHLLALFSQQTALHPPLKTSLIVIDSFTTLISTAFPRSAYITPIVPQNPNAPKPINPSARKFPILQHLLATLQKLAATRNIAILILSQCVTKMRPGIGAVLVPALNTTLWEQGLACRIVLFKDWGWRDEVGNVIDGVRLAQVVKAEGAALPEGRGWLVGFSIDESGLRSLSLPSFAIETYAPNLPFNRSPNATPTFTPPILPRKRKRPANDLEIPDSEGEDDEDYGWAEEDEEDVPAPPPQWQGSEDILIPDPKEVDADGEGSEDEGNHDDGKLNDGGSGKGENEAFRYPEIGDSEDELAL
ncbi:P-loop containing nucleoside triphosphate hydrolase protein [Amylocarpus encephaloides]|uniref:P-loop containing nucleoside triphosphate hydrolase protein n=1 Tax=Amylocarpus encephaloides TaxID=45428 RepID=A0A9P8C2G4_9HELO|nr:P-loop containing nucleoside triphosphate hydrolase protein [Amylocarpus encephaloides]